MVTLLHTHGEPARTDKTVRISKRPRSPTSSSFSCVFGRSLSVPLAPRPAVLIGCSCLPRRLLRPCLRCLWWTPSFKPPPPTTALSIISFYACTASAIPAHEWNPSSIIMMPVALLSVCLLSVTALFAFPTPPRPPPAVILPVPSGISLVQWRISARPTIVLEVLLLTAHQYVAHAQSHATHHTVATVPGTAGTCCS